MVSQSGQAEFSTVPGSANLDSYIAQVYRTIGGAQAQVQFTRPESTTVNGIPAAYSVGRAQTQQGVMDVSVIAYQFAPDRIYHITAITRGGAGFGPFASMIQSVRRLTAQQAAAIRPRVIQIVTVGAGDTLESLAGRMAYSSFQLERFRALNGLGSTQALQRGQRVKLIVYGRRS